MAKKERIREALDGLPTLDYLMRRVELGWRPDADQIENCGREIDQPHEAIVRRP